MCNYENLPQGRNPRSEGIRFDHFFCKSALVSGIWWSRFLLIFANFFIFRGVRCPESLLFPWFWANFCNLVVFASKQIFAHHDKNPASEASFCEFAPPKPPPKWGPKSTPEPPKFDECFTKSDQTVFSQIRVLIKFCINFFNESGLVSAISRCCFWACFCLTEAIARTP